MIQFRQLVLGLALGLLGTACSTYSTAIDEFDSIAGWNDPQTEPATVNYPDVALQYPWYAWFVPADPVEAPVENPAGFARERIDLLAEYVSLDLTSMAQVTRRLLWVAHADPNAFNRIRSLQVIERILRLLQVDLLDDASYSKGLDFEAQARQEKVFLEADATLRRLFGRRDRPALSNADRTAFRTALQIYTAEPLPRLRWQRDLIRTVWSAYVTETDPGVIDAAAIALRRAIRFAACNGLRAALVPDGIQTLDQPQVRLEVVSIYRRLGGIRAVSFLLDMLKRTQSGSLLHRFDQDLQVRMSLVRLCAQLKFEHADAGPFGDQRPIAFLYSIAVDESEDGGVRQVALEGLARCLSERLDFDTVPSDDQWARDWWKRDVVERKR